MKKPRPRKLQIRLSIEEYDQLEKLAAENLVSKSAWLRYKTLHNRLPKKITAVAVSTYQELGRIGNNINQLAKASNIAINRGQVPRVSPEVFLELKEMLTQIRAEILDLDSHTTLEDG